MRRLIIFLFLFLSINAFTQQKLQPGFNANEYAALLSLSYFGSSIPDSAERIKIKDTYHLEYSSPEVGLLNRWSLYLRNDNVGVIDIRGTVQKLASWLENFYAAMIPATGSLQLNDSTIFNYKLSADPKAMVHTGWTIGLGYLAPDIETKINEYYKQQQVKEFLLFGHSQGGAISFLLRAFLEYEKQKGKIPADIVFKTYCSAAPKPGNLYFAYDYDFITRNGWGFTIVNTADWVPETPFSIQTINDFNTTNPFIHIKEIIKKEKFIVRMAVRKMYKKLDKSSKKAQKKFEKSLGRIIYSQVKRFLPQFKEPAYTGSSNYMRAGVPVILMADDDYRKQFPESDQHFFIHHQFSAYYALLKKYYMIR
jgi:predicted lipase